MTINEILAEVQELKPSQYDEALMIKWLSRLEAKIIKELVYTHIPDEKIKEKMSTISSNFVKLYSKELPLTEDTEENEPEFEQTEEFSGYGENDYETELLIEEPYAEVYTFYIMSMIDYYNGETARYANSSAMFNNAYMEYAAYYNRTHEPITVPLKVF